MIRVNARLFAAASICIGKEETRYYLTGVRIEPHHEKGALLVATDGHRLICIHDVEGECTAPAIIKLPDAMVSACVEWITEYDDEDGTVIGRTISGSDRSLIVGDNGRAAIKGHFQTLSDCRIDGTYPEWRKVIPKAVAGERAVPSFNASYLGQFGECAELLGDRNKRIRLMGGAGLGDPALVLFARPYAFGVIMPTRDDGDVSLSVPKFAALPQAEAAE